MTENTTYNGWKNYETWATSLWIGNEQGIYNDVFEACNNENFDLVDKVQYVKSLMEHLIYDIEELPKFGLVHDLLGYAFQNVDWIEIVDGFTNE